jgi:hypothetical protein
MKNYSALLILLTFILASCSGNNQTETTAITPEEDTTKVSFFPVTSFLKGQAAELDSMQITFLHTVTVNNKTDSVWEKRGNIRQILKPFFAEEINDSNLVAYFKPTKFFDQTINAVTFTYNPVKPLPDSLTLRHWDLYINPETGKVTKVYMIREVSDGGKRITLQQTWQAGKWAKLVTLSHEGGDSVKLVREDKLTWNFE